MLAGVALPPGRPSQGVWGQGAPFPLPRLPWQVAPWPRELLSSPGASVRGRCGASAGSSVHTHTPLSRAAGYP